MQNPIVYIIILHYLNTEDTIRCVESLQKCTYKNIKIIIVDNCSPNDSFKVLQEKFPDHVLIQTGENKGYAGGLNVGVKYALRENAELIMLSNNDIEFSEDFLEPLVESLQENPEAGIVSSKVLYASMPGKIYCAGGRLSYLRCGGISEGQGQDASAFGNEKREISLAEGCCMLVRRQVFERIGTMSEKFFMYFEEVDFSIRVRSTFKILYDSRSVIYHKAGAGLNWTDYSPLYYYYYTRNRMLLFSGSNMFYRVYVCFYSTLNTLAKTAVLTRSLLKNGSGKERLKSSLSSMWRGYFDGVKVLFT